MPYFVQSLLNVREVFLNNELETRKSKYPTAFLVNIGFILSGN
jgi:hypothetical protein